MKKADKSGKPIFVKIGFQEVRRRFTNGADSTLGIFIPPYLQNTPAIREDLAAYQATIKYFDECVGRILKELDKSKIAGNTIVVFTADHGIPYPGAKWSLRKAGVEIPLIIWQPGSTFSGGKVQDALMSNIDFLPTLLDYIGLDIPDNMEGVTFYPFLSGKTDEKPRKLIFAQFTPAMKRDNESRCVFDGKNWYIHYFDAGRNVIYPADVHPQNFASHIERCKTRGTRPFYHLYNIKRDPYCLNYIGSDPANRDVVDDPLLKGATQVPYYKMSIDNLLKNR